MLRLKPVNFCRVKANLDIRTNNIRVPNNSFEGNSRPAGSTEITGTNHAGRRVATLSPSDNLPPPLYSDLYSNPPPSYLEVVGQGVESAEIPTSPAPSHQLQPGQDIEPAGSPWALAHRSVEASNSSHDPALGHKIYIAVGVFMIVVISITAGLLLLPEQDGHGKS